MIKKISISHVKWNKVYEVDVEKGMKKIAKNTVTYGVPLFLLGGTLAVLGNVAQQEAVVAYVDMGSTNYIPDISVVEKVGERLAYWVKVYLKSQTVTEYYKTKAARNIVETFKVIR